jgi:integrase
VDHVWQLIDAAATRGELGHAMVYMDAFTGLRRNEILALEFTDIDWFSKEVSVTKAISKIAARDGVRKWQWEIGSPKSPKSVRRVALPETVGQLLAAWRQARGPSAKYIFSNTEEGFLDLRHFFASMLIAQGESRKYICDQLGPSSIQVTFDIYGHLFP